MRFDNEDIYKDGGYLMYGNYVLCRIDKHTNIDYITNTLVNHFEVDEFMELDMEGTPFLEILATKVPKPEPEPEPNSKLKELEELLNTIENTPESKEEKTRKRLLRWAEQDRKRLAKEKQALKDKIPYPKVSGTELTRKYGSISYCHIHGDIYESAIEENVEYDISRELGCTVQELLREYGGDFR